MGGTSFDTGLVRAGEPALTTFSELEWGIPIAVPMVDVRSVGAGGGSVAWVDAAGIMRVGPESAGADPGPACYGRGGERADRHRRQPRARQAPARPAARRRSRRSTSRRASA